MFNGFFYDEEEGKQSLMSFIDSVPPDRILLIIDPPFGGLLNALRTGVDLIWKLIGSGNDNDLLPVESLHVHNDNSAVVWCAKMELILFKYISAWHQNYPNFSSLLL